MTDVVNLNLGGLALGPVSLLDMSGFSANGDNPSSSPLVLSHGGDGKQVFLRYRNPTYANNENGLAAYEISLGAVLAATAIVYSSSTASAGSGMAVLLLLQETASAQQADEGLRALIIEPLSDGDTSYVHVLEDDQVEALLALQSEFTTTVLPADAPADLASLVSYLQSQQAPIDISAQQLPDAAEDVQIELPDTVTFDADGVFYFRDILVGEADFLSAGMADAEDLSVAVHAEDATLFLLLDDEDYFNLAYYDETDLETSYASGPLSDVEGFLARLVVLASGTGAASLRIEFYLGDELIAAEPLIVNPLTVSEFLEGAPPILEGDGAIALAQPPAEEYFGSEEEDYFPDIGPLIPDVL
jgi:hypothetical protein